MSPKLEKALDAIHEMEAEVEDPIAVTMDQVREWLAALAPIVYEYELATAIQGDEEVLRYVKSGNAVPVTRCTVSADLIRQLVENRRSRDAASNERQEDK